MLNIFVRRARRATAIAATILALVGPTLATATAEGARPTWGALVHAPQTDTLYKSDGRALQRSDDSGAHWTDISLPSSAKNGQLTSLAVAAGEQAALYAAGPGVGVLKSVDDGKTWASIDQSLPSREVAIITAHSTSVDTVYAVLPGGDIYRSEDGGAEWRKVGAAPEGELRQLIHSSLEGSMQTGWLFAATDKGVYRSMDCFCGFRMAGEPLGSISAVIYDPQEPMQLYAAAGQQVFGTGNGGEEWQPVGSPGGEVAALAHSLSGVLYALLVDGRVVQSKDKGGTWE
ncbi:MAG: YCF48-related protein [Alphaproteobacteria bacterium]